MQKRQNRYLALALVQDLRTCFRGGPRGRARPATAQNLAIFCCATKVTALQNLSLARDRPPPFPLIQTLGPPPTTPLCVHAPEPLDPLPLQLLHLESFQRRLPVQRHLSVREREKHVQ